ALLRVERASAGRPAGEQDADATQALDAAVDAPRAALDDPDQTRALALDDIGALDAVEVDDADPDATRSFTAAEERDADPDATDDDLTAVREPVTLDSRRARVIDPITPATPEAGPHHGPGLSPWVAVGALLLFAFVLLGLLFGFLA
ncbi:MAG TPA: hypothetical protein VNT55_14005, partial [Baekduia sp.]|nr:hypothetical protein [Baekduia sp.]